MAIGKSLGRREFLRMGAAATALGGAAMLVGCSSQKSLSSTGADEHVLGWTDVDFKHDVDICVVGAGSSGLAAAYGAAANGGGTVLCIEKQETYGGDAANSANTFWVPYAQITTDLRGADKASTLQSQLDGCDKTYADSPELCALNKAWYTYTDKWMSILTNDMQCQWQDECDCVYTGIFWPEGGIGQGQQLWKNIYDHVADAGVDFEFGLRADTFIVDADDNVVGLRCYDTANEKWVDIKSKSFILCTGGFAANQEMMAEYYPDLATLGCVTTQAQGEGIKLGVSIGGDELNMGAEVNCNPHLECIHVSQSIGRSFSMLSNGHRFHNEAAVHSGPIACVESGNFDWWVIFDNEIVEGPSKINVQKSEKYRKTGNTIEELAAAMEVPLEAVQLGFDEYNAVCDAGVDEAFGRKFKLDKLEPPYYAMHLRPCRYKTAGGLRVSTLGELLDKDGEIIPGIYAAGCTGGTTDIAPAGGSGLLAGESCAAYIKALA